MPSNCSKCGLSVKRGVGISCGICSDLYHPACQSVYQEDLRTLEDLQKVWSCRKCQDMIRSTRGDDTPIRTLSTVTPNTPEMSAPELRSLFAVINEKLDTLIADQTALSHKVSENSDMLSGLTVKLHAIEKELSNVTGLVNELQEKVFDLEVKLNRNEQERLKNSVEIRGVPLTTDEDLQSIVLKISTALNVNMSAEDIDGVFRPRPRQASSINSRPPPIIVRFLRLNKRDELITKRRVRKELNVDDIGLASNLPLPQQTIYIDEALTPFNRKLFAIARDLKKNGKVKFVWVRNGNILVRQSEGAPVVVISTQKDLDRFL
ncbi:uncharacterized protein LOC124167118 [Ischnura elegans]|uniref:uncharacterized protein LOC124167118 n=1 Tax=Ischnura elegans TaxID=197161 RepID=UPI001ED8B1D1|nr:uncharacterized protein LOC124167118 [Ischnura elegans]